MLNHALFGSVKLTNTIQTMV